MIKTSYYVFLVLYFVLGCEAVRILIVVPFSSIRHQTVFHPFAKELASRGHEVVTITTDPAYPKGRSPTNLTEIDVHDISYGILREIISAFRPEADLYDQMKIYYKILYKCVEVIFEIAEVQKLLKHNSKHFDLLMIERFTRSGLIFSHLFEAPVISISSFGMMLGTNIASGAPEHPLLYPNVLHQNIYNLTLWDKTEQLWKHMRHDHLFSYFEGVKHEMLRNLFGPDVLTLRELTKNIDMFLHIQFGLITSPCRPMLYISEGFTKNLIKIYLSYRDNVMRLSSIINDEAQPPLECAVWWTEYVLRHAATCPGWSTMN